MELRRHVDKSTVTMAKTAEGKVKVENREDGTDEFVWNFHLSPDQARKFGQELIRLADELT